MQFRATGGVQSRVTSGSAPWRRWQTAAFALGLLVVFVALESPVDTLSASLFWMHMVQHLLLIMVAAPLLVAGDGAAPLLRGLPLRWRRPSLRYLARQPAVRRSGHRLSWLMAPRTVLVGPLLLDEVVQVVVPDLVHRAKVQQVSQRDPVLLVVQLSQPVEELQRPVPLRLGLVGHGSDELHDGGVAVRGEAPVFFTAMRPAERTLTRHPAAREAGLARIEQMDRTVVALEKKGQRK